MALTCSHLILTITLEKLYCGLYYKVLRLEEYKKLAPITQRSDRTGFLPRLYDVYAQVLTALVMIFKLGCRVVVLESLRVMKCKSCFVPTL